MEPHFDVHRLFCMYSNDFKEKLKANLFKKSSFTREEKNVYFSDTLPDQHKAMVLLRVKAVRYNQ